MQNGITRYIVPKITRKDLQSSSVHSIMKEQRRMQTRPLLHYRKELSLKRKQRCPICVTTALISCGCTQRGNGCQSPMSQTSRSLIFLPGRASTLPVSRRTITSGQRTLTTAIPMRRSFPVLTATLKHAMTAASMPASTFTVRPATASILPSGKSTIYGATRKHRRASFTFGGCLPNATRAFPPRS